MSFDPEHSEHWKATALRCFACRAKEIERERFTDSRADMAGLYMTVRPSPPPD